MYNIYSRKDISFYELEKKRELLILEEFVHRFSQIDTEVKGKRKEKSGGVLQDKRQDSPLPGQKAPLPVRQAGRTREYTEKY